MLSWLYRCCCTRKKPKPDQNVLDAPDSKAEAVRLFDAQPIPSKVEAAFKAIQEDDRDTMFRLLNEEKLDPNARKKKGDWTLLQKAVLATKRYDNPRGRGMVDRNSILEMLLRAGARPDDLYDTGRMRTSALHLAVRDVMPEVVDLLLARGADPLIIDDKNKKPSDYIAEDTVDENRLRIRESLRTDGDSSLKAGKKDN